MTASRPPNSAPQRRLSRRAALRPDRLLAALPPLAPPPPTGLRAPDTGLVAGGDPGLPPLNAIVYNRLAFGPRPGDLAAFNALPGGSDHARLTNWVDTQLNPNAINDAGCEGIIAAANLPSLNKSLTQLWADHYDGNQSRTQPISDVRTATFLRAVHSSRQLKEVMVDFWHNHFNVFAWDYAYASATWVHYDRDVIRYHALGNFRTFLGAVARSTAMLYYLDNYISYNAGENENYARESFELHTLGAENYVGVVNPDTVPVDENDIATGYCDNDVYEVARAFTGWRVNDGRSDAPGDDGTFYYHGPWHDVANKRILGPWLPANQPPLKDGEDALDRMAFHPGTACHIAGKLCRRLIADDPPQTIVDQAAMIFFNHSDDPDQIKAVVRTICLSDEFKAAWGQKVKRPFEVAAGILRATNATFTNPNNSFWYYYESAGQPLFSRRSPDGYPDRKSDWSNTTSLMQRWRFANLLVQGYLGNASVNLISQMPGNLTTPNQIVDFWIDRLLGRPMDPAGNRDAILAFMAQGFNPNNPLPPEDIPSRLPHLVALILMAPDFQWR